MGRSVIGTAFLLHGLLHSDGASRRWYRGARSRSSGGARGEGIPTAATTALSRFALLVLEPAHFIMERRMLLGIRERAERA